jgi:hypothetical protein
LTAINLRIVVFETTIMLPKKYPSKDEFLGLVVLFLVLGNVALAVIDESTRPAFADLSKVALGAYLGLLMPSRGTRQG